MAKVSRYSMYIAVILTMIGVICKVNRIDNAIIIMNTGLIGLTISFILVFINAEIKQREKEIEKKQN